MHKRFIVVANLKEYFGFWQTTSFIKNSLNILAHINLLLNKKLLICPCQISIASIGELLKKEKIGFGAQDCSRFDLGAFTGQISAASLKEIGCEACIIGHAEKRKYDNEEDDDVSQKLKMLLKHSISPIICVGENGLEYGEKKTIDVLKNQLSLVFSTIKTSVGSNQMSMYIAYEPVWAIGTQIVPTIDHLNTTFKWLKTKISGYHFQNKIYLLYGGSINSNNIKDLKKCSSIDGFLVGKASTDIVEFEKIVKNIILE